MEAREFLVQFHDFLAPKLDPYEQVIYLYVVRHSRLIGQSDVLIGINSAARNGTFGTGLYGGGMSPHQCRDKISSLITKGCLETVATEHRGTRLKAVLPSEMPGLIPQVEDRPPEDIETLDFYTVPENRALIFEREQGRCFYCLRKIDDSTCVIEHVISRPSGDNSYRNVVAACRQCNNRKGSSSAEDYFRTLYRESFLGPAEFEDRLSHLERLRAGELKPAVKESPNLALQRTRPAAAPSGNINGYSVGPVR